MQVWNESFSYDKTSNQKKSQIVRDMKLHVSPSVFFDPLIPLQCYPSYSVTISK